MKRFIKNFFNLATEAVALIGLTQSMGLVWAMKRFFELKHATLDALTERQLGILRLRAIRRALDRGTLREEIDGELAKIRERLDDLQAFVSANFRDVDLSTGRVWGAPQIDRKNLIGVARFRALIPSETRARQGLPARRELRGVGGTPRIQRGTPRGGGDGKHPPHKKDGGRVLEVRGGGNAHPRPRCERVVRRKRRLETVARDAHLFVSSGPSRLRDAEGGVGEH